MVIHTDCLVIGSGVAGMAFALRAAELGRVTLVTKAPREQSNSAHAQGGIAAVWHDDDTYEQHVQDTLIAGAGLCRRDAVEVTVREGPARVRELIELGTRFTRRDSHPDEYDLHREGGHSQRRILHADDITGREIVRALGEAVEANPNIDVLSDHVAIDVITRSWLARRAGDIPPEDDEAVGAYVLDIGTGDVDTVAAKVVIMATGGAGKVYKYTTNPPIATGDGIAMAYRAGARIANMEMVQFHPTALYHPKLTSFLISEALRGEGGTLILPDGTAFMAQYDPERRDLAPRDIVARAIDHEIKRRGLDCVYLDMTHLGPGEAEKKFPNIHATLLSVGIDMQTEPIPVVPACHYFCGGVLTDLHGESSVRNLFAVGEASCTGLHGANRLASNSLLEALVFSHRAAAVVGDRLPDLSAPPDLPPWDVGSAADSDEQVVIQQVWGEIRRFMWNYVGIVRTHRRLERARHRIELVQEEIRRYYWDFKITADLIELRNLAQVAELVVDCAMRRRESRGLHYTLDFPEADPRFIQDTVLVKPR